MKPMPVRWTLLVIVLVGQMFLPGCRTPIPPTPVRSFGTMDLLIGLSDMPEGWRKSENSPSRILDYLTGRDPATADDASRMVFLAEPYMPLHEAAHEVYRFKTSSVAKQVYESRVLGTVPQGWEYQSAVATESKSLCYVKKNEPPYCSWLAYYNEYYVEFSAALIPGKMSLQDIERIVQVIDEKMAQYLNEPSE